MLCKTLDCVFDTCFDPGADADQAWIAIQVYRDGNQIDLGRFATEYDALTFALAQRDEQLGDNGQFGVGA